MRVSQLKHCNLVLSNMCLHSYMHIPMQYNFMSAQAHATAWCVLDIPAALKKQLFLQLRVAINLV